jgi:hypothetical protein
VTAAADKQGSGVFRECPHLAGFHNLVVAFELLLFSWQLAVMPPARTCGSAQAAGVPIAWPDTQACGSPASG